MIKIIILGELDEIDFYKSKNLSIPKRCPECRQANKINHGDREHKSPKKNTFLEKLVYSAVIIVFLFAVASNIIKEYQQDAYTQENDKQESITFRNDELRDEHYLKHGKNMGFSSSIEYEIAAATVITNADSLHKIEAEDGDDVLYLERTNEFVILSTDGYIRTYFYPDDGIDYFNQQ